MSTTVALGNERGTGRVITRPAVLTVEGALYALIAALALAVRMTRLGYWPLLPEEATTALGAWRAVHGDAARPEMYVPLLFDAQAVAFWLQQAGETAVRLLPALAGAALVGLPWVLRERLGRVGAIAAALLIAFAPTWVFASRTAGWPILSAAVSGLLLAGLWRFARTGTARGGRLAALALGIGWTAGPGILTAVAGLAVAWLVKRAVTGERGAANAARKASRGLATTQNCVLAAVTFGAIGTGLLGNVDGVAQSIEWAGRWFGALVPGASGLGPGYCLAALALYEPLTLGLALTGAVWGIARRDGGDAGLAAWALVALALGTVLGHRDPVWLLDALLPLVLLAARGAQRAWDALRPGFSVGDGIAVYGALIVTAFGLLALARYTYVADDTYGGYALLTAGALLIAWVAYWLWAGDQGLRVGAAVLAIVLAVYTVRSTTALAYQTGRDPREPMLRAPTSLDMRAMEDLLASTAAHRALDRAALNVEYDPTLADVVAWGLRDYPRAGPAPVARAGAPVATVLLRPSAAEEDWPAGYVGQTFRLRETWDWANSGLPWRDRLRWLLYRQPVGEEDTETLVLWVRMADGAQ